MERRRSWIVLAIVFLTLLALVAQRIAAPARAAAGAEVERVTVSGDGTVLRGESPAGVLAFVDVPPEAGS
jgi:hypothetical protein